MGRYFGTDGIRGRAGVAPLDPPTVQRIGRALVRALGMSRPRVLIGRDTRESSPSLEAHIAAGLSLEGAEVISTGVIPTPAIAHLARRDGFDLGVVLSASHNPYEDNGIKVFGGGGRKFTTELEERTESFIDSIDHSLVDPPPVAVHELQPAYIAHLRRTFGDTSFARGDDPRARPGSTSSADASLGGLRLVLDCANGATSFLACDLFSSLGAEVIVCHDTPDGRNINERCGATVPEEVARQVVARGADVGVAFDGDGDRAMFADAQGRVVNGDHVLFLAARHLHARGRLKSGSVVATVMSNLGLEHALAKMGIPLVRTAVGDRNVLEEMERRGANLGGEQSGHVIFLDYEPTGDGLLTALQTLAVVRASGRSLADLTAELPVYPQVLLNARVRERVDVETVPAIRKALDAARDALEGRGRLVVRYSGTEPLLRVMAEGPDETEIRGLSQAIVDAATQSLGAETAGAR
jgi:phosphoglucosamine mutase